MVGEALMRISNTMEAERLTKSLDYQEKLRSRANIRLIIGIICMFIAFMLLLLSGMLLFILLRYEDPILDVWVPLIKAILHGMNVSFQATVAKSSYDVIQKQISIWGQVGLLNLLKSLNNLDLNGLLSSLGSTIGNVSSTISGVGTTISSAIAEAGGSMSNAIDGLGTGDTIASAVTSVLDGTGIDNDTIESIIYNIYDIINGVTGSTNDAASTVAVDGAGTASLNAMDLLSQLSVESDNNVDLLGSGVSIMQKMASALSGLAGIFG